MKQASCPKGPSHKLFRRKVEVTGFTSEVLDEGLNMVHVEDCTTFRLIRRFSDLECLTCGTQANVYLPF
jgi:hypothetical protein